MQDQGLQEPFGGRCHEGLRAAYTRCFSQRGLVGLDGVAARSDSLCLGNGWHPLLTTLICCRKVIFSDAAFDKDNVREMYGLP